MTDKPPLVLTSNQQSLLAEICSVLRGWHYNQLAGDDSNRRYQPNADVRMADEIRDVIDRFVATPQTFDVLYDRLHRSGANA